jgi:uncharacterized OB-fold protein
MITCPNCGAQNDDGNRFCDQCGTRLDAQASASPPAPATDQPTVAAQNCPNCGSPVMPGEAFCDNCGAALTAPAAAPAASTAAADAPTMLAAPPAAPAATSAAPAAPGDVPMIVCAVCGHHNLPGEAFCDNCGAALTPAAHAAETVSPYAPTVVAPPPVAAPDDATVVAPPPPPVAAPDDATVVAPPPPPVAAPDDATVVAPPPPPVAAPDDATVLAPPPSEPSLAPTEPIGGQQASPAAEAVSAPTPEAAAPTPAATVDADAQAAYDAKKAELEAEVARQQQIIAQFEQMQATFGAATPAAVVQGLAEARDALTRVEGELNALQPPAPAAPSVDPAEVARLEEEIARQQQIIAQFEQMQTMFGAATPPAVSQGLAEARDALARVQGELAALTGGAPVAPAVSSATPTPAAEATIPAPAPTAEATTPAPAAAPAEPASAGPRLVLVDGGQVLPLPTDKAEIIIGREDPVSNIFPEIDLTPFGGENGGVSRQHARINQANGSWTITDLNSTNYTRVDGVRLDPTVPAPLKDGARVQFGRVAMMFHL